jgi:hypothetical protein
MVQEKRKALKVSLFNPDMVCNKEAIAEMFIFRPLSLLSLSPRLAQEILNGASFVRGSVRVPYILVRVRVLF